MKYKRNHSTILENRLRRLLSDLPPTNFSVHPRDYEANQLWLKLHHASAAAVFKSWLPAPTRRCAGPPQHHPQLRHVSTAATPRSPAPLPHNHFLRDSDSILEAALQAREASYWCLLERSDAKRKADVQAPSDRIGPRLTVYGVGLGPNEPYSGLTVTYGVLKDYNSDRRIQPPLWLIHGYATIRYECAVSDPFDARRKPMEFADVILCGGKYYSVSLQGAVVAMEVIDTRLQIAAVGSTRAVPSSRSLKFFKEYLVEMDEEILIVYLIHHESVEVVDEVEVFRLDLDRLELMKVERMQGRTMFLKESRYEWVESAEFGCRDNCVFFTEGKEKKWRVYDFKTCCISSL